MPHSEQALLLRIAESDEHAFEQLFHLYLPRLTPFALKLTGDRDTAREMIQETFLRIWLSRDRLPEVQNPSANIYTILSNQCFKFLKRKLSPQELSDQPAMDDPHDAINLQELKKLVAQAVANLSEQRRKIFILSREKGMTIPEIAGELSLSPNTVKNTLVSALQAIREYLQSQGYHLPTLLLVSWLIK